MAVWMRVRVGVSEPTLLVPVAMFVNQVSVTKQRLIAQYIARFSTGKQFALFHHEAIIGDIFH